MAKQTRGEYLADSLEQRKPWLALDPPMSRRSFFRKGLHKLPGGTGPVAQVRSRGTSPGTSRLSTGTGPVAQVHPKKIPGCPPADAMVHEVLRQLEAAGKSTADEEARDEILRAIEPKKRARDAARIKYKRNLPRVLSIIGWAHLARTWAGQQWDRTPWLALEFVYAFVEEAGPVRAGKFGEIFEFLDKQAWAGGRRKFERLQEYRGRMASDPTYFPTLALWTKRGTDDDIGSILALMRGDRKRPWKSCDLADALNLPRWRVRYITKVMCNRTPPLLMSLGARGPFVLPNVRIKTKKPGSWRAIQMLYEARDRGLKFIEMESEIPSLPTTLRTLRGNRIATPADPKRKAPIWLTPYALPTLVGGAPIRNKTGVILWAPERAGSDD
jgi:hypothetical protein